MNSITNIYLVRHAESIGNINGRFNGWNDLDLTDKGIKQAELLQNFFKDINIDEVYSSPLIRAHKTASISIPHMKDKINKVEDLKEIHGGDWEGETWENLKIKWPEVYHNWDNNPSITKMPNGESMSQFFKRIVKSINEVIDQNIGKNIAVFTHGGVIKVLISYFLNLDIDEIKNIMWHENSSVTKVVKIDDNYEIEFEGYDNHLPDEYSTIKHMKWYKELYLKDK